MNKSAIACLVVFIFLTSCINDKSDRIREEARESIDYMNEISLLYSSWSQSKEVIGLKPLFTFNTNESFVTSNSKKKDSICLKAKELKQKYGIPKIDFVGELSSNNFLLIVKDCNCDLDFQKEVLNEIRIELKEKNITSYYFAMIEDRVRVNEGLKQKYGTIVELLPEGPFCKKNEAKLLTPVNDSLNLDDIRSEIGLPPFNQFLRLTIHKYNNQFYINNGCEG